MTMHEGFQMNSRSSRKHYKKSLIEQNTALKNSRHLSKRYVITYCDFMYNIQKHTKIDTKPLRDIIPFFLAIEQLYWIPDGIKWYLNVKKAYFLSTCHSITLAILLDVNAWIHTWYKF